MASEEQTVRPVDEAPDGEFDRYADRLRETDRKSEVIEGVPPIYMRGALYVILGAVFLTLLISWFARVHVVVKAKGQLVPELENVFVEARETGTVKQVHVKPGEPLKAGQLVLTLERAASGTELQMLVAELRLEEDKFVKTQAAIEFARAVVKAPQSVVTRDPSQFVHAGPAVEHLNALRRARQALDRSQDDLRVDFRKRRENTEAQIRLNVTTLERLSEALQATRDSLGVREKDLEAKALEFKQMEMLAERRAVPRSNVNQAREALIQAESMLSAEKQRIGQLELDIARTRLQSVELKSELDRRKGEFDNTNEQARIGYDQALVNLNAVAAQLDQEQARGEARIAELRGRIDLQNIQIRELQVVSPAEGVLSELRFTTPGQLVERGARVGSFVPSKVKPVVVATVENKDVAGIKPGLRALVKVDAYPFRQFGTVSAKVLNAFPVPEKPQFKVRLQLDRHSIRVRGVETELVAGLNCEVDILTDRRRILQLILRKLGAEEDD